jgi:hypothetical protein
MALDLRGERAACFVRTFTANQTATEIQIPAIATTVTIGCENHSIYWSHEGTEGQTLGANKDFIAGGAKMAIKAGRGRNKMDTIYIATKSSSSATVTLIFEEE